MTPTSFEQSFWSAVTFFALNRDDFDDDPYWRLDFWQVILDSELTNAGPNDVACIHVPHWTLH